MRQVSLSSARDPVLSVLGSAAAARYGLAVGAVLAAVLARMVLGLLPHMPAVELPFALLSVAVMAAAAFGGTGPGVLAGVLACVAGHLLFDPPRTLLKPPGPPLVLFALEAGLIILLGARFHAARRRAHASEQAGLWLEQRILEISEEERRRIGHDLHDGLGQHLTAISLLSQSLASRLNGDKPLTAESLAAYASQADRITSMVSDSIRWTRDLARGLSPLTLETEGLVAALEELAINASNLFDIRCTFDFDGGDNRLELDGPTALHVYRIVQEAVNNSVRHGKAKEVRIELERTGRRVNLRVADRGTGLSARTIAQPGIGLRIMQYRARMIGAALAVERIASEGGTLVTCSFDHPAVRSTASGTSEPGAPAPIAPPSARE